MLPQRTTRLTSTLLAALSRCAQHWGNNSGPSSWVFSPSIVVSGFTLSVRVGWGWVFYPLAFQAEGVLSLLASVCLSIRLSVCCMNFAIIIQWIYFTIWKKIKKNHHHCNTILSLYNIISRHYKKSLLRSQIYHGYEELSTDTNYPIWRRQERRSKYAVQLASWQLRSNSPKTSVQCCGFVHTERRPS